MGVIMNLNTYLSFLVLVVSFFVESLGSSCNLNNIIGKYSPDWDSLDARPLPSWYDDAKVGIFIHWGVFSVPSFATEWFWEDWRGQSEASFVRFMNQNYKPNFTYTEFAPQFTAELYDPQHWANVFKKSGAKYVVLTSKHHEGYTLWPSATSWNWNSVDVGPHKDLVGSLATAVRNTSLRFGVYHSLYEWFNPLYLADKSSSYQERQFVEKKVLPEMLELISKYKPEVLWSDGQWEAPSSYWCSREFLAWLYNSSPVKDTVVTNDRWGSDTLCKHGGYLTCQDRYSPGKLQPKKWENAMTLDKTSWGFNRLSKLSDYLSMEELLATLVSSVSCGGNILINVGPTADGRIVPIMEERLLQLGEWLQVNGDAIYKTEPWKFQNDTLTGDTWYTKSKSNSKIIFATFLTWPESNVLELSSIAEEKISAIFMLQRPNEIKLRWSNKTAPQKIQVYLPNKVKTQWAWSLRLELQ